MGHLLGYGLLFAMLHRKILKGDGHDTPVIHPKISCVSTQCMEESCGIPLVIDVGSGSIKAGFVSDESQISIPSIVGKPSSAMHRSTLDADFFIGEEAIKNRSQLTLKYPIEHGIVTNYDDFEKLLHHVFYHSLRIAPEEHPLFITDSPVGPKANREKMTQIAFETFNVPKYFVQLSGMSSLFATGRTNGIVLDSGDGVTHVIPVYDGYWLPHAVQRIDIGGRGVTLELMQMLNENNNNQVFDNIFVMDEVKKKVCYVPLDFDEEMARVSNSDLFKTSFTLPDGKVVELGSERFAVPEILFKPDNSLPEAIHRSIKRLDKDLTAEFYENIVLAGGNTMFHGFPERFHQELTKLAFFKKKINVIAPQRRNFLGWIGAAIVAQLSTFEQQWITKEEYDEHGPALVHRKCF